MNGSSAWWRTRVGTRIVGSTARTSNSDARRQHEGNGRWAGRKAFVSGPRRPDLLVPRHVRIERMLHLPRAPHGDHGGLDILGRSLQCGASAKPSSTTSAVARDGCVAANKRRLCESAVDCEEDGFTAAEIVKHRGDAVGPLLQGRERARCDRIGRSRARLVEEDQSTERCHRLDPPLKRRQLRKDLTVCEPVRHNNVARAFTRRAIGDAQVPVQRIARLREHRGSLSRGAGRAVHIGSVYAAHGRSF